MSTSPVQTKRPRIVIIGAGRFGWKHLQTWQVLRDKGLVEIVSVICRTPSTRNRVQKAFGIDTFPRLTPALLTNVDGVDIVTPPETHYQLISQCLPFTHVLVEKPLMTRTQEGERLRALTRAHKRVLMVGHTFRFHPLLPRIQKFIQDHKAAVVFLESDFINSPDNDNGRPVLLEMLHPFDFLDFTTKEKPIAEYVTIEDRIATVDLLFPRWKARVAAGWGPQGQKRTFTVHLTGQRTLVADLGLSTLTYWEQGRQRWQRQIPVKTPPLEQEFRTFLAAIQNKQTHYPDVSVGIRVVRMATPTRSPKPRNRRPRVAVIGGGIFGANCALELAPFADVTIFERHSALMQEASLVNQYRHHWGFHYPRSVQTVEDIRASIPSFERRYGKAIIRKFPTYYSVAKHHTRTSAQDFLQFCRQEHLPFRKAFPPPEYLNRKRLSICLKTFEPIYNYTRLKSITEKLLDRSHVCVNYQAPVQDVSVRADGVKELQWMRHGRTRRDVFDYVVNVTYARHNQLPQWCGFPEKTLRIDAVEALMIKLPIPRISLAVMDGPFTNMVPTGEDGIFTLVHIRESIHKRFIPENGLVPESWLRHPKSRAGIILKKSQQWIPILKKAEYLESRYVFRGVNAYHEYDDARPSDIAKHGFGCWSVLGGKIVNAISVAQSLAEQVRQQDILNSKGFYSRVRVK